MLLREIKQNIFAGVTLIVLFAIISMVDSEILPSSWYSYAEPLSEQKFAYICIKKDYQNNCKVSDGLDNKFSDQQSKKIYSVLKQMNCRYKSNEKLKDVHINLDNHKFRKLMEEADRVMNSSEDGFYAKIRTNYEDYTLDRFNFNTRPKRIEQIEFLEDNIDMTIACNYYVVNKFGVGPGYSTLIGFTKMVNLSKVNRSYLENVLQQMRKYRKSHDVANTLKYDYECYESINVKFGRNTNFAKEQLSISVGRQNTYQEEVNLFREMQSKDNITNAYARYFCDYLGILAGILPALYGAFRFAKDRRNKTNDYIYSSNIKSIRIVFVRVLSILVVFSTLFYIVAGIITIYFYKLNRMFGYHLDYLAFFKYVTIWIIPTVCIVSTGSVLLYILTQNEFVAFFIQFFIFFLGIKDVAASYNVFQPIIRFNYLGEFDLYKENCHTIWLNRCTMLLLSGCFIVISAIIYERRRQGKASILTKIISFMKARYFSWRKKVYEIVPYRKKDCIRNRIFLSHQFHQVLSYHLGLSILFLFVMYSIFALKQSSEFDWMRVGENCLSLISLFIFIPICNIERFNGVYEMLYVQKKSYATIFFTRLAISLFILAGMYLGLFLIVYVIQGISLGIWCIGVYLSAVFLGLLGTVVSEITRSRRIGIGVIVAYYMICMSLQGKMKYFSICGYTYHISNSKYLLLIGSCFIMLVLLGILWYERNGSDRGWR